MGIDTRHPWSEPRPRDAGTGPLAILESVSKTYRMGETQVHALNSVDLEIGRGEFLAIVGPSGSGKTTLLNLLGGIDSPSAGRLVIDGTDLSRFDAKALTLFRREKIGFIFQFFNLIPTLTARENVEFVLDLVGRDGERPTRGAAELLDRVGLGDRLDHFPAQLSGGEQQRVAVARALAKDPVLVLGDEPTGNLDYRTGKLVLGAMNQIHEEEGTTVILVTHNTPLAQVADRILHMRDGEIVEEETVAKPIAPEDIVW
jgi:putative ABC transport system ATP-binding protein